LEAVEIIITIGGVATAIAAIWGLVYGLTKWVHKQNSQSTDIEKLEKKHDTDTQRLLDQEKKDIDLLRSEESERIQRVEDELCVISYAVLAVLDGLKQQGCNGEVTKAHTALEKYLNQKAHGQK